MFRFAYAISLADGTSHCGIRSAAGVAGMSALWRLLAHDRAFPDLFSVPTRVNQGTIDSVALFMRSSRRPPNRFAFVGNQSTVTRVPRKQRAVRVSGTAVEALQTMQSFLRGRPSSFPSLERAIEWRYATGACARAAARTSSTSACSQWCDQGVRAPSNGRSALCPSAGSLPHRGSAVRFTVLRVHER